MINDNEHLRILMYQYILFKGGYYDERSKNALNKLQTARKYLTSSDYVDIYRDILTAEIFRQISVDITRLLDLY